VRKLNLVFLLSILSTLFISCASQSGGAEKSVTDYLNALVAKDANRISTLSCAAWEQDALIELDSLQAVTASLQDLACAQSGTDGDMALVSCTGKLIASYNGENQELDLSVRTYQVVQENGDWLVCGTR
jgi:hypothetical protein